MEEEKVVLNDSREAKKEINGSARSHSDI